MSLRRPCPGGRLTVELTSSCTRRHATRPSTRNPRNLHISSDPVRRAQRAYDKIDRWCEIGRYECAKGVEEANTYLHPYAINWSDEHQQLYFLSRKEQAKVRRWWHRK